jgi:hypothetical protein
MLRHNEKIQIKGNGALALLNKEERGVAADDGFASLLA